MLPDLNREEWQARFDEWFPLGANVGIDPSDPGTVNPEFVFIVPRIMVARVSPTGSPVLVVVPVNADNRVWEWEVRDIFDGEERPQGVSKHIIRKVGDGFEDVEIAITDHIPEEAEKLCRTHRKDIWYSDAYYVESIQST